MSLFVVCVSFSHAQQWPDEHRDPPFYYHADFSLQRYHGLLRSVSDLQSEVPRVLGLQTLDEPVHLFLFARHRTYQLYVKKYFPTVPNRPALFIKQRGPGMVFARLSPEFATDLRHETTHAVLHGILPMVPLWLDEGLGEYFEVASHHRISGNPHLRRLQVMAQQGPLPEMEPLEQLSDLSQMGPEHYRAAWAWVHFMLHHSQESHNVLVSYLRDIEASSPPGDLSRRLRSRIPRLQSQFAQHFSVAEL